jgi:hypothetical protein
MFRVVSPPNIRSTNICIYSIRYLSYRYCYLLLQRQAAVTAWQIPGAVDTVVWAPDDGWWYRPKHVEQFPDKINYVTLYVQMRIFRIYVFSDLNANFLHIKPKFDLRNLKPRSKEVSLPFPLGGQMNVNVQWQCMVQQCSAALMVTSTKVYVQIKHTHKHIAVLF